MSDRVQQVKKSDEYLAISTWRAVFTHPDTEKSFQHSISNSMRDFTLFGLAIVIALEAITFYFNLNESGQRNGYAWFVATRALTLIVGITMLVMLLQSKKAERVIFVTQFTLIYYSLFKIVNISIDFRFDLLSPINLIAYTLAIFVIFPMNFIIQVLLASVFSVSTLVLWGDQFYQNDSAVYVLFWLVTVFLIGAYVARSQHLRARQVFANQQRLEQVNHRNSVLLSVFSHEVLNPLNALSSKLELWQEQNVDTERFETVRLLVDKAMASLKIWYKEEAISKQQSSVDLFATIDRAIRQHKQTYPQSKVLWSKPSAGVANVSFDSTVLAIACQNILDNAYKHGGSDKGCKISIREYRQELKIRIRDFGPGISGEDSDIVFTKHYTCNKSSEGPESKGLGLYITRELLKSINGDIAVHSEKGKGCAFYICLKYQL